MSSDNDGASQYGYDEPKAELIGKRPLEFIMAYISCPQDSGRNYLGGILITDWRTRPLEFSFVSPVKVTVMQRIIHGKTLDEAVTVDLVAKRLLTEAIKQPDIIFVDSDLLLGLQRLTKIPVTKLSRDGSESEQVKSLGTVKFSTANGAEMDSLVGNVLSALEPFVDLLEPFSRMADAIKEAMKAVPQTQGKT